MWPYRCILVTNPLETSSTTFCIHCLSSAWLESVVGQFVWCTYTRMRLVNFHRVAPASMLHGGTRMHSNRRAETSIRNPHTVWIIIDKLNDAYWIYSIVDFDVDFVGRWCWNGGTESLRLESKRRRYLGWGSTLIWLKSETHCNVNRAWTDDGWSNYRKFECRLIGYWNFVDRSRRKTRTPLLLSITRRLCFYVHLKNVHAQQCMFLRNCSILLLRGSGMSIPNSVPSKYFFMLVPSNYAFFL